MEVHDLRHRLHSHGPNRHRQTPNESHPHVPLQSLNVVERDLRQLGVSANAEKLVQDRLRWQPLVNLIGSMHGVNQEGPDPYLGLGPGPGPAFRRRMLALGFIHWCYGFTLEKM